MTPVTLAFPSSAILPYLYEYVTVDHRDYGWIVGAAFCLIENSHSYDDAYLELNQYLLYRLPGYNNDKVCLHAAAQGYDYTTALYEVADDYTTAILGVAECMCSMIDQAGVNHLYTAGYGVSAVHFIMDMTVIQLRTLDTFAILGQREWLFTQLDTIIGNLVCLLPSRLPS